ncbi:MAG: hypothetical protein QW332_06145 [Thermoproteota archaeon]
MSIYDKKPRLRFYFYKVADWIFSQGIDICYTYENRKHHYVLWKMFPIRIKPDTFRRILCELSNRREYTLQKYGLALVQKNGYYWLE